jgi:hypothetical protein
MSQKRAVIVYSVAFCVVTFLIFGNLKRVDASSEAFALVYALWAGVGGLGTGGVMTHFRK